MSFVPIIVPTPQPSPRAQELARRIRELIDQFRREHPGASNAEVNQALQLAATRSPEIRVAVLAALLTGLLLLGVFLFTYFR